MKNQIIDAFYGVKPTTILGETAAICSIFLLAYGLLMAGWVFK